MIQRGKLKILLIDQSCFLRNYWTTIKIPRRLNLKGNFINSLHLANEQQRYPQLRTGKVKKAQNFIVTLFLSSGCDTLTLHT